MNENSRTPKKKRWLMARYPSSQTTDHDCHPNLWKLGGGLHKTWSRVCFYFGTCFLQFWGRLREGDVFQTAGSLMEETWTSVVVVVENASLGSLPAPSTPLTCPLFSSSSSYLGSLLSLHSIIDHAPPARIGPRPFFFPPQADLHSNFVIYVSLIAQLLYFKK